MQSTSASDGTYNLTVTFAIGTSADEDEILVQNRVSAALSSLPAEVQLQGVTTKKQSRFRIRAERRLSGEPKLPRLLPQAPLTPTDP